MTDDLTMQPAARLVELIRSRSVSPVEVVAAHLRAIERLNPALNAVVTLAPDALERARAAEEALMRGVAIGPLHGLPFTVKDTIDTAGVRTTSGSLVLAGNVPKRNAPAVDRLLAAGGILLGKTNTAEMAMSFDADNPVFGRTNNPHDLLRTPGGSSGGEAAAIAACLSPGGLGSDLAGSVRVPAHFCGICGLKPTPGVVPFSGQNPLAAGPFSLGAVIGPMARGIADLSLFFDILRGPATGGEGREALPHDPVDYLRGWRVACYVDDGVLATGDDAERAVQAAMSALRDAGLVPVECRPPGIERGPELWAGLFGRQAFFFLAQTYAGQEERAGPLVRAMLSAARKGPPPLLDDFIAAWIERDSLRSALVRWMESTPLILAPVGATAAPPHEARKVPVNGEPVSLFRAFGHSQTFNVFGLPAVCVPAGRSREGLPVGVQIAGRPFDERYVLAAARIVEEALGGWQPPALALPSNARNPL